MILLACVAIFLGLGLALWALSWTWDRPQRIEYPHTTTPLRGTWLDD